MKENIEIYVWLYAGSAPKLRYGHAAISIPWYSGAHAYGAENPYPLYISFHRTALFKSREDDIRHWESATENCYLQTVKLPCTQKQIAALWQNIHSMKNPEFSNERNFNEGEGYYIPYCHVGKKVYNVPFELLANQESNSDSHNCTTLILKLLQDAEVELPGEQGERSNQCRQIVTTGSHVLNGGVVGYNVGVAVEVCKCLGTTAEHIRNLAIASFVIMAFSFVVDAFCMPRIFQQKNINTQPADKKNCLQHPKTVDLLKSLPILMLLTNVILLVAAAIIHGQYHALFDSASGIGLAVGLGIGSGALCCLLGCIRSIHHDSHSFVTKPKALLDLLGIAQQENVGQAVKLEEALEKKDSTDNIHFGSIWNRTPKESHTTVKLDSLEIVSDSDSGDENSRDDLLTHNYIAY